MSRKAESRKCEYYRGTEHPPCPKPAEKIHDVGPHGIALCLGHGLMFAIFGHSPVESSKSQGEK